MSMSDAETVGFAGLSHLGIVSSLAATARGFSVLAFDEKPTLVEAFSEGRFPISEPGLEDVFRQHRKNIQYTADVGALAACRLIFVTLDVPTDDTNTRNLEPLRALVEKVVASKRPETVLVIMSQVPPGFCRELAGYFGPELHLFYQVETLVFGNAVERAIHPERFMVGSSDVLNGLPEHYRRYLDAFECPVLTMRYESAELCKIAINCFLVASVSTTNMLSEICECIHADWAEIAPALRLDQRIGRYAYLSPGLGIAGGNLERDLVTVERLAAEHHTDGAIVRAWKENSSRRKEWVLRLLLDRGMLNGPQTRLAIWGIAYKPETRSTKNSPSLALINALKGYQLRTYDPAVTLDGNEFPHAQVCQSTLDTAEDADIVVVMTPWKEFREVPLTEVKVKMRGRIIVDPFGALEGDSCRRLGFDYYRLGVTSSRSVL